MKKYLATAILLLTIVISSNAQVELSSSGTGAAYTLSVPGVFTLRNGIQVTFKAHANSSAAATMNVSGTGAISIMKDGGTNALTASDIKSGQIVTLAYDGAKWQMMNPTAVPASSGTVTSVDFTVPAQFTISGTPLTTSGTIGLGWQSNSQNLVLATPNGSAGTPTFRSLVANDIPNLDASKITTGLLPLARGGTNAALTATNGGIVYSNATGMAITAAGASGEVLQSNGAGAPTWVSLAAIDAANKTLSNLTNPTAVNQSLLPTTNNTLGLGNSANSWKDLYIDGRLYVADAPWTSLTTTSTFIGIGFVEQITSGLYNMGSGYGSGKSITTGFRNTAVGYRSGENFTSSSDNTLLGNLAGGLTSTLGNNNTLLGSYAGYGGSNAGSDNTFVGYNVGGSNTSGNNNTAVGSYSSYNSTTATNNVYIGYNSGQNVTTGGTNTFIGANTGLASSTQRTNSTAIGYGAVVDTSNAMVLGGTGASALNVGIGITSPKQRLHVEGGRLRVANGSALADLYQSGVNTLLETSGQFQIYANGSGPEFTIDDGNANFYVPLLIQDGSQANNRVLTSNASGYATWTDLSAISSGTTAWTKTGTDLYPTNISDFVGIGTTPTASRLSVANNLAGGNTLLITNETGGTTSVVSGTKGGRISVTANDNNPKTGLEVQVGGTGTGQQNALFVQASGAASAAFNRGLVAGATNNTSSNIAADLYADGNSGTNYGLRVNTAGTQAATKYAAYLSSSGSGTKYGVYATGEDLNYFSGNVGIGTTTVNNKLDVEGAAVIGSTFSGTNTAPTNGLLVEGNVGIGTPSPGTYGLYSAVGTSTNKKTLTLSAFGASFVDNAPAVLEIRGGTNTIGAEVGVIDFIHTSSGSINYNFARISAHREDANATYGSLRFYTRLGATLSEAMIIDENSNVGIGTSTPIFPLHVETSTQDRAIYVYNTKNTTNTTFAVYGGAYGAGSGEKRGGSFEAVNGTGINIGVRALASGGATNWAAYFIGNSYIQGRLGINETVPLYDLDVSSTTTTYAGRFKNEGTGGADGLRVEVNTTAVSTGTRYGTYSLVAAGLGQQFGSIGQVSSGGTTNYGVWGAAVGGSTANYGVYCNGSGGYTGTWTLISDQRFKENIKPLTGALDKILKLEPKTYNLKSIEYEYMNFPTGTQIGLISQEVEKIIPELVEKASHPGAIDEKTGEPTGNPIEFKSMNYIGLTPVLVQAIKEQQLIIEQLKARIEALEKK